MLSDLPCKSPYSSCVKRLTQASINQTAITVKCLLYHSAEYKQILLRKIIGQVPQSFWSSSQSFFPLGGLGPPAGFAMMI